jgi:hypothetical protein
MAKVSFIINWRVRNPRRSWDNPKICAGIVFKQDKQYPDI